MYEKILTRENFEGAYFEIVRKLEETCRSQRYCGVDGVHLNDIDLIADQVIDEARNELAGMEKITPVLEVLIPKPDLEKREVYVYTLKDRLKSQAVFRIIDPLIEKNLSPYLFSYRSSHPTYLASRSVAKRYRKTFGEDYILVSDISRYSQNIDRDILREKFLSIGIDNQTINYIYLLLYAPILANGKIIKKKGMTDGNILTVLCYNFYLNDVDHYLGKHISLYRRVGDDFILMDKNKAKLLEMRDYLLKEIEKLKLKIKKEKTVLIKSDQPFKYVGYNFHERKVSIKDETVQKFIINLQKKLKFYPVDNTIKLKRLPAILYSSENCIYNDFIQLLSAYRSIDDEEQIKQISEKFFRLLTKYFYGKYTSRNQRLTKELTKNIKTPSLYQDYLAFHHGKTTLKCLSVSKKKFYQSRSQTIKL